MWDTANLEVKSYRCNSLASHISRKTSEIWATRHWLQIHALERRLMTEATIAAPAPGAAPVSTPVVSPAPAAPAPSFGSGSSVPASTVDPGKFPIREDYAAALLKEKLAALPASEEQPVPADEPLAVTE